MLSFTYRHCASLDDSAPPYYLVAELAFESAQALTAALNTPEGHTASADVAKFADGGVTMFVAYD